MTAPSSQVERPVERQPGRKLAFQLGGVEGVKRADLDAEGGRAVGAAGDLGAGGLEPVGEQVAHPLADRRRRVGAGRVLQGLELDGAVRLDYGERARQREGVEDERL